MKQLFECVLLDSPRLSADPDRKPFAERFRTDQPVVTFSNLGGDAILVMPCPVGPHPVYAHLAAFVRGAPDTQQIALWRAVGEAMRRRVGSRPIWAQRGRSGSRLAAPAPRRALSLDRQRAAPAFGQLHPAQ